MFESQLESESNIQTKMSNQILIRLLVGRVILKTGLNHDFFFSPTMNIGCINKNIQGIIQHLGLLGFYTYCKRPKDIIWSCCDDIYQVRIEGLKDVQRGPVGFGGDRL